MKQKTPEIGAQARTRIAETLPQAIEKAVASYHDFTDGGGEEPKDFQSRHTAAKAALAHIELLLKLAALVEAGGDGKNSGLEELIQNAKSELDKGNA